MAVLKQQTDHIQLDPIGPVNLKRSAKARYIRLKVDGKDGVTLIIPDRVSEKTAIEFALSKQQWIKSKLNKIKTQTRAITIFDEQTLFKTRYHQFILRRHNAQTLKANVGKGKILIFIPHSADIEDEKIQTFIRHIVIETWRMEAKHYLPNRVEQLAERFGFNYNRVSIKNTKTRWGSCSAVNNINLNLQLMRLPEQLSDYIILHELVHTKVKNHGPDFWNLLEKVLPGARKLDKQVNTYDLNGW